ncbi:hypothetical protein ACFYVL_17030 [Streptomyces sp. NPDC004111]|uniref:hypothetical protein n=1 Tax=Streptomyces sp. NPDC004111 TaxID=3364690 RepID=UPI0036A4E834
MVWDEWEKLKGETAERRAGAGGGMQLNQLVGRPLGADGGGAQGRLAVDRKALAAIAHDAYVLFDRLGREGRTPIAASAKAAGDLKGQGFALGGGMHRVQERWEQQVRSLVDACAHISHHMKFTAKVHRDDEHSVKRAVSSIKQLETSFDERSERGGVRGSVEGTVSASAQGPELRAERGERGR